MLAPSSVLRTRGSCLPSVPAIERHVMELHFPTPMTIRCFKCSKVFEVAFTSEERREFPCPVCGEVEV